MTRPKLIGIIGAPIIKVIKDAGGSGVHDYIKHIAFDVDGRAWALVVRSTPLSGESYSIMRVTLNRFQLLDDVPFVETDPISFFDGKKG